MDQSSSWVGALGQLFLEGLTGSGGIEKRTKLGFREEGPIIRLVLFAPKPYTRNPDVWFRVRERFCCCGDK